MNFGKSRQKPPKFKYFFSPENYNFHFYWKWDEFWQKSTIDVEGANFGKSKQSKNPTKFKYFSSKIRILIFHSKRGDFWQKSPIVIGGANFGIRLKNRQKLYETLILIFTHCALSFNPNFFELWNSLIHIFFWKIAGCCVCLSARHWQNREIHLDWEMAKQWETFGSSRTSFKGKTFFCSFDTFSL